MSEWQKISLDMEDTWKPEKPGEYITGTFRGQRSVETVNGTQIIYSLAVEGGTTVSVWGRASLNGKMMQVKTGDLVKILYAGERKNTKTGRTYKDFEVYKRAVPPSVEQINDDVPF